MPERKLMGQTHFFPNWGITTKNKQFCLAGLRILLTIPTTFALIMFFTITSLGKTTNLLTHKIVQPTLHAVQTSLVNLNSPQQKPVAKQEKATVKFTLPANSPEDSLKTTTKYTRPVIVSNEAINLNQKVVEGYRATEKGRKDTIDPKTDHKKPIFPGGTEALEKFLRDNIKYPVAANNKKIKGTVFILFDVSETGIVSNPKIRRSAGDALDKEAIRLVCSMPQWIPAVKNGKPVNSNFLISIKFYRASK